MTLLERTTRSELETDRLAAEVARVLRPGDVLALVGDLGAGKTRFVRGLAMALGFDARSVSSPTFVLVNEYEAEGRPPLVHVDAYRLTGEEDLGALGWDRLADGRSILAVEWADRVAAALPAGALTIRIEHAGRTSRRFIFEGDSASWSGRLPADAPAPIGRCPTCGGPTDRDGEFAPFCSDRCRMADLNRWFTGGYTISRDPTPEDFEEDPGG